VERRHAIIVVKNSNEEYLQYFDERWNSFLFLNCKVKDENDITEIQREVSKKLSINNVEILYKFNKLHTKFSESDKIEKEYRHYFYEVNIREFYEFMNSKEFDNNGIKFKWYSYDEFLKDERIQKVNSDIVGFIKEM